MIKETKAIVIKSIKYGDNNLIVTCYTKECGTKTYLLRGILKSKKGSIRKAHFQILTQLNIVANHNNKGNLNSIKDVQIIHHYQNLQTDIIKQSIALFLSEILYNSLREEEENLALYEYIETALVWLDTHDNVSNFHLLFLLNITKYLGFSPDFNPSLPYFDLLDGKSTSKINSNYFIEKEKLDLFKQLLGTNFDALQRISLNAVQRQEILDMLIQYISLHLQTFKKPKSLQVLHKLFD